MAKIIDLKDKTFGKLTVIQFFERKNLKTYWLCKCSCNKEVIVQSDHLKNGHTKSCGCLRIESGHINNLKHGLRGSRIYRIWNGILQRCSNSNNPNYYKYGGRGITVDFRWLDFKNFEEDMYESYLKHVGEFGEGNTSIDRINNAGNYIKDNCKWSTNLEQVRNTRASAKTENYGEHLYWKVYYMQTLSTYLRKNIDSDSFENLFGIRLPEFKKYIESLWFPGMTWNNRGSNKIGNLVWQLDHIKEIRDFDLSKEEDRKVCFNYKNYQPLWWESNRDKALARL